MPTREGTATGLLAGAVFLLATNLASGLLFVLDALLVALLLVGAATSYLPLRGLRAQQRVPPRGVEGGLLPLEITLEASRAGRFLVVEGGWPGTRARALLPRTDPGVASQVSLALTPAVRGQFALDGVTVMSRGPLGLFSARRRISAGGRVVIWPRTHPVSSGVLAHMCPITEGGSRGVRTRAPEDLYGVCEFRPGDSPSHIHWRSSARRGALVVREFERPHAPGVAVVVDLDRRQSAEHLDATVRAAASLHLAALDRGADVVLVGWEGGVVEHRGREAAMDWLAGVVPCAPPLAEVLPQMQALGRHLMVVSAVASGVPSDSGALRSQDVTLLHPAVLQC